MSDIIDANDYHSFGSMLRDRLDSVEALIKELNKDLLAQILGEYENPDENIQAFVRKQCLDVTQIEALNSLMKIPTPVGERRGRPSE